MKRRVALASLAGGATLLGSGCLSVVLDTPAPVHFELWNRTENAQEVSVTSATTSTTPRRGRRAGT